MTIKTYLLDHIPHTIFWIFGLLLLDVGFWLLPNYDIPFSYLLYLDVILTVLFLIFLLTVFFYRKSWYQALSQHVALKQQALNVPLTGAQNHSQQYITNHINQLEAYHHEIVDNLLKQQEAQQTFIETWVHDVKVPLAAEKLLTDDLKEDIPVQKRQALEIQWQKINHAIDQVLYYSRLNNFSNDYLIQAYDLHELAVSVVKANMDYFFSKKIKFSIDDTHFSVLTDKKWLSYILEQLLSNALKYTPKHGSITIHLQANPQADSLTITDTGIGIEPKDLPRVFDKGFTGSNGRFANQNATGLGLYLARQLAEKLGHQLTVTSKVGQGTTFTLRFPHLDYYNETDTEVPLRPTTKLRFNDNDKT